MFGFKKKKPKLQKLLMHRDEAAKVFLRHCRQEADKLFAAILPPLRSLCDGEDGRPTLESVMSRSLISFEGPVKIASVERPLIASHCYAITTAIGLDALDHNIDPSNQSRVMEWKICKSIIEEDVGPDNVGSPPSPWIAPNVHVQYDPGTFVNGVPSPQKELTDKYRRLSIPQKVVVLLMALGIIRYRFDVSPEHYQKAFSRGDIVGRISDAGAPLREIPTELLTPLKSAMTAVDPFWPAFTKSHHVTWR